MRRPPLFEEVLSAFAGSKNPTLPAGLKLKEIYGTIQRMAETIYDVEQAGKVLQSLKQISPQIHYFHSLRVGVMYRYLARKIAGLGDLIISQTLDAAGLLHDAGKGEIDPEILEGKELNEKEREIMNGHNQLGYLILQPLQRDYFPHLLSITMPHHSYPRVSGERRRKDRRTTHFYLVPERRGDQNRRQGQRREKNLLIEEADRMLVLCDQYDSLASERSYKPAYPLERTRRILSERFPEDRNTIDDLLQTFPLRKT